MAEEYPSSPKVRKRGQANYKIEETFQALPKRVIDNSKDSTFLSKKFPVWLQLAPIWGLAFLFYVYVMLGGYDSSQPVFGLQSQMRDHSTAQYRRTVAQTISTFMSVRDENLNEAASILEEKKLNSVKLRWAYKTPAEREETVTDVAEKLLKSPKLLWAAQPPPDEEKFREQAQATIKMLAPEVFDNKLRARFYGKEPKQTEEGKLPAAPIDGWYWIQKMMQMLDDGTENTYFRESAPEDHGLQDYWNKKMQVYYTEEKAKLQFKDDQDGALNSAKARLKDMTEAYLQRKLPQEELDQIDLDMAGMKEKGASMMAEKKESKAKKEQDALDAMPPEAKKKALEKKKNKEIEEEVQNSMRSAILSEFVKELVTSIDVTGMDENIKELTNRLRKQAQEYKDSPEGKDKFEGELGEQLEQALNHLGEKK